jgi:hypothetical protein
MSCGDIPQFYNGFDCHLPISLQNPERADEWLLGEILRAVSTISVKDV